MTPDPFDSMRDLTGIPDEERAASELHCHIEKALKKELGPLGEHIQLLESGEFAVAIGDAENCVLVTGRNLEELYQEVEQYLSTLP